jgi:hypothetical protein
MRPEYEPERYEIYIKARERERRTESLVTQARQAIKGASRIKLFFFFLNRIRPEYKISNKPLII